MMQSHNKAAATNTPIKAANCHNSDVKKPPVDCLTSGIVARGASGGR
jgi:hypothetical protein